MSEIDLLVARATKAQQQYAGFSQEDVDRIFYAGAMAANSMRIPLAQEAVEETGMGLVEDKVTKNHFASEIFYHHFKDLQTCGTYFEDENEIVEVMPVGVVAAIVPTTNPTSTAIFKALCGIKSRCAVIFSPHPRAKKCTCHAAKVVMDAAIAAGAPEHLIQWLEAPSVASSNALMCHPNVDQVLATGGPAMVKAAYSSGKPALGVGPGNVPVIVDDTADLDRCAASVIMSKTFDHGVVCASEQAVIAVGDAFERLKSRLTDSKCYILSETEKQQVADVVFKNGNINPAVVGQSAPKIARMSGITVAEDIKVLVGVGDRVDAADFFSHEKLSPCLGLYPACDYQDALDQAEAMLEIGGKGHSAVLYTSEVNAPDMEQKVARFAAQIKTCRLLVNQPSSHGGIGALYNFNLMPSMTLGCGTWGGNLASQNVGPQMMIHLKRIWKQNSPLSLWKYISEVRAE